MSAEPIPFDEDVGYDEEVEEPEYEEEDGAVEEVGVEGSDEEIGAEADDEEEQGGAGGGRGQMLYIPGLGYIPLSSLGNIPGLNLGGGGAPRPAAPAPETLRDWQGLSEMPTVTQEGIADLFDALEEDGKKELTVLLLGRGGAGKSSTLNSLFNERAANVLPFQQDSQKPTLFARRAPSGFVFNIIDTPSLLDGDAVSDARLEEIGRALRDRDVDAVLYVDRLDTYAADALDTAAIAGVTRVLGPSIWNNAVVVFTRSSEAAAPPGVDFEDHVAAREAAVRAAIAAAGAPASADVAVALAENSSRCPVNADGEKIVPGEVPWVADLLEKIVDTALNTDPWEYHPEVAARASNPNRRRKWLIPLVLAAQVGLKLLLDRVMDDDGCRGDANGPFDEQTVKERRDELAEDRRRAKRRAAKAKAKPAAKPAAAAAAVAEPAAELFEDDDGGAFDEEDEDDWE